MIGDFDVAKEAARTELRAAGISEGAGRVAVDLGAGPGAHAIALAEAGYAVTAINTGAELLEELRANCGDRVIRCVNDDLLRVRRRCEGALDVVLCMGDTLTHCSPSRFVWPPSKRQATTTPHARRQAIFDASRMHRKLMSTFRAYRRDVIQRSGTPVFPELSSLRTWRVAHPNDSVV